MNEYDQALYRLIGSRTYDISYGVRALLPKTSAEGRAACARYAAIYDRQDVVALIAGWKAA